jgi:hypothetical protein
MLPSGNSLRLKEDATPKKMYGSFQRQPISNDWFIGGRRGAGYKDPSSAKCQWLTPIILASQEAEIRRITV